MAAGTQVAPLLLMIKLTRMVPWVGAAFALAVLASTMRRKGVLRGALDAALDVTPVLGGVKMIAEKIRGQDFIPDRPPARS